MKNKITAIGIIPARYASTRFPGKPLALIAGKPMIQRVYENAVRAQRLSRVIVATDDERIMKCVLRFGGVCIMTDANISTGTERVATAAKQYDADIILNIQGDEPLVSPELLDDLVRTLEDNPDIPVCTPVVKISSVADLTDSNQARVVFDNRNRAIYFTRAVIPFNRDIPVSEKWLSKTEYWKHIGIYCFRRDFLNAFINLPPGRLEQTEKLEQLRIIEHGFPILVVKTDYSPLCVDVPADIAKVESRLKNN